MTKHKSTVTGLDWSDDQIKTWAERPENKSRKVSPLPPKANHDVGLQYIAVELMREKSVRKKDSSCAIL